MNSNSPAGWLIFLIIVLVGLWVILQVKRFWQDRDSGKCRVVVAEPRPTLDEVAEPPATLREVAEPHLKSDEVKTISQAFREQK